MPAAGGQSGVQAPGAPGVSGVSKQLLEPGAPEWQQGCGGGCVSPKPAALGAVASDVGEELSTGTWSRTTTAYLDGTSLESATPYQNNIKGRL